MSGLWPETLDAHALSANELVMALETGTELECWGRRAAVTLIVAERSWLDCYEFRQAVEVVVDGDGRLWAWVDWTEVDSSAVVSLEKRAVIEMACYLAGICCGQPLPELVAGLDDHDLADVLRAVEVAARGQQEGPW